MKNKIFIDTNVLIDVVTNRNQPHVIYSQQLFAEAVLGKVELYVSALSLVTTIYVARKYNLSEIATKNALKQLIPFMQVVDVTAYDVINMLDSDWHDYEDSVQNSAAENVHADYIVTGNIKDFQNSSIAVLSPQTYLGTNLN